MYDEIIVFDICSTIYIPYNGHLSSVKILCWILYSILYTDLGGMLTAQGFNCNTKIKKCP